MLSTARMKKSWMSSAKFGADIIFWKKLNAPTVPQVRVTSIQLRLKEVNRVEDTEACGLSCAYCEDSVLLFGDDDPIIFFCRALGRVIGDDEFVSNPDCPMRRNND